MASIYNFKADRFGPSRQMLSSDLSSRGGEAPKDGWNSGSGQLADDPAFDRLTKLAERVLNVRQVLISLVDDHRVPISYSHNLHQFAFSTGDGVRPTHCEWIAAMGEPLRIDDVSCRTEFADNPSITQYLPLAYFGVPIRHSSGSIVGVFAAIDDKQRHWTDQDGQSLVDFAAMVMTEIGFRTAVVESLQTAQSAKAAEQRLSDSEQQYRSVIDNINEVVFQTDDSGRWTFLNPAWEKVTGYSIAESLGTGFFDRVHPEDRERNRELFAPLIARRKEFCRHEIRYLYKNGGYRWIEVYARLTLDSSANVVGTSGTLTDITDRYESIKRMAESEVRFRGVVECLGEGLIITGLDDRVQYVNARMAAMTGYTPREMIGRRTYELLHPRNDHGGQADRNHRRAQGIPEQYEMEYRRKSGESFWVEVHATPFRDADGEVIGTLSANLDISSRKQAEDKLMAMTAELQRSNESLQEFASVASHDLQEPLRKIQTFSDRLRKKSDGALGDEGLDYLQRIESAAGRMQSLIRDLLLYSRVTTKAQPFKQVDLNQVVAGVLSDLEARLHRTAGTVQVDTLPEIAADPLQMRQLFQNLISNALKFHKMDLAPKVHIWADILAVERNNSEVASAYFDRMCRIYIEDNGIGFDPKYSERVFEVFERLNARTDYEGTGMGLAICRRIAERHRGTITAKSVASEGTTFIIDLPMTAANREVKSVDEAE